MLHMMNYARILLVPLLVVGAVSAQARQGQPPPGLTSPEKLQIQTPQLLLPAIDAEALRRMDEDTRSGLPGAHDKRLAVAHGYSVNADSKRDGSWQILENGDLLWRLTLRVPGATDLHLGFETYELSDGAQLWVTGMSVPAIATCSMPNRALEIRVLRAPATSTLSVRWASPTAMKRVPWPTTSSGPARLPTFAPRPCSMMFPATARTMR